MALRDRTALVQHRHECNASPRQTTRLSARLMHLSLVMLSSLIGCASTSDDSPQNASASINSYPEIIETDHARLTVFGLSCPLCATNVERALTSVPGVLRASIDLSNGRIDLLLDPMKRTRSVNIAHAVKDAGFTLRAIELP